MDLVQHCLYAAFLALISTRDGWCLAAGDQKLQLWGPKEQKFRSRRPMKQKDDDTGDPLVQPRGSGEFNRPSFFLDMRL